MKITHYVSIAVLSYLIFLLTTIPVSSVKSLIDDNTNIKLHGTSGTIWNGHADSIVIKNKVTLKNTQWSFNWLQIFAGKISFFVDSNYYQQKITGEFNASLSQQLTVNNLRATIPAKKLAELANIPLIQLAGMISINIDNAHWQEDNLPAATGMITWDNASVTVADTVSLGKVTIVLSETELHPIKADIKNKSGDLKISGNAELIPEASYAFHIELSPTNHTNTNIEKSLIMFTQKQSHGRYLIKKTGKLSELRL